MKTKKKDPLPRLMWADYDPRHTRPIAVYFTRASQRENRPDLQPIRVRISRVKGGVK